MKKGTTKKIIGLFLILLVVIGISVIAVPNIINTSKQQKEQVSTETTETEEVQEQVSTEITETTETEEVQEQATIELNQTERTLYVGEYTTVKVVNVTGLNSKKATYKSSDEEIATVTKKGVVKGIKAGTADIIVTSKENNKVESKFTVTVNEAPKTEGTARAVIKSDFDISGAYDGGLKDKDGKLYTNMIDYIDAVGLEEFFVDYSEESLANPKTFTTARGIKLGSTKSSVIESYSEISRDMAYKDNKMRKGHMQMLHENWDIVEGHTVTDYVMYMGKDKGATYRIEFVIDQNDKVMGILFENVGGILFENVG